MERKVDLSQEQRELIEKFGVYMERTGTYLAPIEARIIGLLAVSDVIELTFEEIQQLLNVSKGATSSGINRLLAMKRIEYITKPGERKRYFRLALAQMEAKSREKLHSFSNIGKLWEEILAQRTMATPDFNRDMERIVSFMKFIEVELPLLFEKWERMSQH
jgi:DNA-binding transcriptional regulator GbsR (MarR family)